MLYNPYKDIQKILSNIMSCLSFVKRPDPLIVQELAAIRAEQASQRGLLEQILAAHSTPTVARVAFEVELDSGEILTEVTHLKIKARQKFRVTLKAFDLDGNEAPYDGAPQFVVPDSIATFTPDPDNPKSGLVQGIGKTGTGQVSGQVDADMGEGVKPIVGTLDLEVLPGDAVVVQLDAGPAED